MATKFNRIIIAVILALFATASLSVVWSGIVQLIFLKTTDKLLLFMETYLVFSIIFSPFLSFGVLWYMRKSWFSASARESIILYFLLFILLQSLLLISAVKLYFLLG
jgi:hypothetical protein